LKNQILNLKSVVALKAFDLMSREEHTEVVDGTRLDERSKVRVKFRVRASIISFFMYKLKLSCNTIVRLQP